MNTTLALPTVRRFGYAAALDTELARLGQISLEEFEERYTSTTTPSSKKQSWDPTTARFWNLFSQNPVEVLRQQIAEALDTLLPHEAGPTVPDATLDALLLLWETFLPLYKTHGQYEAEQWMKEWNDLVAFTRAHPLLMVISQWDDWVGQRLPTLRGVRFETGRELLTWLEGDKALRVEQFHKQQGTDWHLLRRRAGEGSTEEALTQGRQHRLHELHRFLTGHYGIHSDFRLTEEEMGLLRQNGFVVSQRLGGKSFGDLYYHLFNNDLPVFVTIDSLLHAWHHSFDAILMEVEETHLRPALEEMLTAMSRQLPIVQQEYGQGVLSESLMDADYFLAVALSLLQGKSAPTQFEQNRRVALTLLSCMEEGLEKFPLFGCDRVVDFSQFKPRGHYEKSKELQHYFRAMMWMGRIDLRVASENEDEEETTQRQLGAALILLDLLRRAGMFSLWQQFDQVLQTFVGVTDSLTFAQLDAVFQQAELVSPAAITDWGMLQRLQTDILGTDAGYQQIQSDAHESDPYEPKQVLLPRSFTLIGQKFTLDSWALSQVVYDRVLWDEEKVIRRIPSALDVAFTIFGNDAAVPDLVALMRDPQRNGRLYRDGLPYQHNLTALRQVIDAQEEAVWEGSLSTQWLHCLRALSLPTTGAEYPEALHTPAWAAKCLNTQLASWTQLRHDTILYTKQSYTMTTSCFYPAGYVEPNPAFWERLEKMATSAADLLAQTQLPQPASSPSQSARSRREEEESGDIPRTPVTFLREFAGTVNTLQVIAAKQTAQAELTEEEIAFLQNIVQIVDTHGSGAKRYYNGWYPGLFYAGRKKCAEADALVADVHTDPPSQRPPDPGCVLHQGVGGVDLMVIVIENGEDKVVFAGPTLSHYEFEMPETTRKSDSEWKAELSVGRFPARPSWTQSYLVAANHIPSPPLVPGSKSDHNFVRPPRY